MSLFNRQITLEIGGRPVAGLRISFEVIKNLGEEANTAKVSIWNMAENSRNQIRELDDQLIIGAGYEEDTGPRIIFIGDVTKIAYRRSGVDIVTTVNAGDGIKNLREARTSKSFAAGTQTENILKTMASDLGLALRPIDFALTSQYLQGFSFAGSVKEGLKKIAQKADLEFSVQNGELQILKKRGVTPSVAINLNFNSGLLDMPERLNNLKSNLIEEAPNPGFRVRCLLNPLIEPGSILNLTNVEVPGNFRVETVKHTGDNFEGDFVSEIEVTEL